MKKSLFVLLLVVSQLTYAQNVEIVSTHKLTKTELGEAYHHPTLSPQGDYVLLTNSNYAGLMKYDLASGKLTELTTATNAGYRPTFNHDGSQVIYRVVTQNNRNQRFYSVKSLNLISGQKEEIVAPCRDLTGYKIMKKGLYASKMKKSRAKRMAKIKNEASEYMITIENRELVLYKGAKRKVLRPNGSDVSYIWPSISPDQKHIVYTVAGKGTFVASIKGENPITLGHLGAPKWLGNQLIVGMNDTDNGDFITSSTIDVVSIDGTKRQTISNKEEISLFPTTAKQANVIAYSTQKGDIYLLKVATK